MIDIKNLDPKVNVELSKSFSGQLNFVQVGTEKWCLPSTYAINAEKYRHFKARPDDIWILGFPRSGTNMMQSLAWLLTHDLDFEKVNGLDFFSKTTVFFELYTHLPEGIINGQITGNEGYIGNFKLAKDILKNLEETKERRIIKSHLPFSLLPENLLTCGCKIIYVARYLKDVAVSHFNLNKNAGLRSFIGSFEQWWNYLENNLLAYNPYWEHLRQGLEQKHNKNVLVLFYEDVRKDFRGTVTKMSSFLNKDLTNDEMEALENHMKIENYQKITEMIPSFINSGEVAGGKKHFSKELNSRADKWIEDNLKKLNLKYTYKYEFLSD